MHKLEVIGNWITEKNASYVCRTDKIWWFDNKWLSMTPKEAVRTINTLYLGSDKCNEKDFIQVIQELGVAYEISDDSGKNTSSYVFDLSNKIDNLYEEVIYKVVKYIHINYVGCTINELKLLIDALHKTIEHKTVLEREKLALILKYASLFGFKEKLKSKRVMINDKKRAIIIKDGYYPRNLKKLDIMNVSIEVSKTIEY